MKTVSYAYVLQKACELTGRTYPPTTEEASFFRTFIGSALRQAWEAFDWPEQTVTQQEFFAPTYSQTESYTYGDVVYFPVEQKYYQAVSSTTFSGEPPTLNTNPAVISTEEGIPVETEGGEVITVESTVPTKSGGTLNAAYWALAKPAYTEGNSWDDSLTYSVGDLVFYEYDQEYYQCISNTNAGTAPGSTAYWGKLIPFFRYVSQTQNPDGTTRANEIGEIFAVWQINPRVTWRQRMLKYSFAPDGLLVEEEVPYAWINARLLPPIYTSDPTTLPYRFSEICAYRAAGQMLRVDGKVDLGNEFLQIGEVSLSDEIDKVSRQEMQVRKIIVPTR